MSDIEQDAHLLLIDRRGSRHRTPIWGNAREILNFITFSPMIL